MDNDAAIAKYEEAVRVDPTNHRIFYKLALAHMKKEEWSAVAQAAESAAKLAPTFASYFAMVGMAKSHLAQKGNATWDEARAPLERALSLDPLLGDAHYDLAEILLRQGDERGALLHYSQAVVAQPRQWVHWVALADLYIRLGKLEHAEKTLSQSLRFVDGEHRFELETLYAVALSEKGDTAGALTHCEYALQSCGPCNQPGQAIAFLNLGAAYAAVTPPRKSEAIQNLQKFHKMICKGAAKSRYEDQCAQAQQLAQQIGGLF